MLLQKYMILIEERNWQESTRRIGVRTILRTIKLMLFHRDIHANKKGEAYQARDNPLPILSRQQSWLDYLASREQSAAAQSRK